MGLGNMSGQRLYTEEEVLGILDSIHQKKLRAYLSTKKTTFEQYAAEHGELNGIEYARKQFLIEAKKLPQED